MKACMLLLALAACGAPSTSNLEVELEVGPRDAKLSFRAYFYDSDARHDPIALDDDDRVTGIFRGQSVALQRDRANGYYADVELDSPVATGEQLAIEVVHDGEMTSSQITAAPITVDPIPLFISRSADFTFSWSPAMPTPMYWRMGTLSFCAMGDGTIPANVTRATILPADVRSDDARTCTSQLEIENVQRLPANEAFAGGDIAFIQHSTFDFASMP